MTENTSQVYKDCYEIYLKRRGRNMIELERDMHAFGHTRFHRRILYRRGTRPGWIERYGWRAFLRGDLTAETRRRGAEEAGGQDVGRPTQVRRIGPQTGLPTIDKPRTPITDSPFRDWLRRVSPEMNWDWRHQQHIIRKLEEVTSGRCKRLMLFLPPRHGKSELVTVRYSAWRMQRDPSMNVIVGSYNQGLADRFSRKVRRVISTSEALKAADLKGPRAADAPAAEPKAAETAGKSQKTNKKAKEPKDAENAVVKPAPAAGYHSPFPFAASKPANTVSEWETTAGGGFRAVGVGGGVTGFGAQLIIVDDPVKSRAEAESETYREKVWEWFNDDLYTRLEPDGAIILIQTRWHEDDLAGRLLREMSETGAERWQVVDLPAIAEEYVPSRRTPAPVGTTRGSGWSGHNSHPSQGHPQASVPTGGNTSGSECAPNHPAPRPAVGVSRSAGHGPTGHPGGNASVNERAGRAPGRGSSQAPGQGPIPVRPTGTLPDGRVSARSDNPSHTPLDPIGRRPGEPLCPERFSLENLDQIRRKLGSYSFAALYQQRPSPAGGGIFRREWFGKVIEQAPPGLTWARGYDLAVSTRTSADYTATYRCAFDRQGNLYIQGGLRARIEFPEQRRLVAALVQAEPRTRHGIEAALHGEALVQELRRDPRLRGRAVQGVKVQSDKMSRALAWAPLAEEGKVFLVRGSEHDVINGGARPAPGSLRHPILNFPHQANWIPAFLDELAVFPNGTHDDQIDAVSLAVTMLTKRNYRSAGF